MRLLQCLRAAEAFFDAQKRETEPWMNRDNGITIWKQAENQRDA